MLPRQDDAITVSTSSSSGSRVDSISRRLSRLTTRSSVPSSSSSSSSKPGKGPLGLNTLHLPTCNENVVADLIFVHGLGGDSYNTWRASRDPSLCWPLEWLPTDADFHDVRIHSFGYDSRWDKESILGVHDFANTLLQSIVDCPSIPLDESAPLVFVAHSMGGLVVKRMYVLAKLNLAYETLATRITSMFFFATPHQGADLAQTLSLFLSFGTSGPRPFISDLRRQSAMIQSLNDEFPRCSQGLQLFSFFETLPTDIGYKRSLLVDRTSAILGYPNERVDHLQANHRDICKFQSKEDANYKTVRNALAANLRTLRSRFDPLKRRSRGDQQRSSKDQQRSLEAFLGVSDSPEDDYMAADGRRMSGSCEWLVRKGNFQRWLESDSSSIYCLSGKPGTGKTVLSGKAISHLKNIGAQCSFYFFQNRNKSMSNIATFLLSMARQMAVQDARLMDHYMEMKELDEDLSKKNYQTIWRKLFLETTPSSQLRRSHYWVVDALDECLEESELVTLLLKAVELGSIRVFFTSRNPCKPSQKLGFPKAEIVSESIIEEDSRSDIALYLGANMDQLPALTEKGQRQIVSRILDKSQGCFLWTNLVLKELRHAHASADINKILDEVPTDMNDLYARILGAMSKSVYGKPLSKAIITWTVCATQPLSTSELHEALTLDLQDSVDSIEASILSSCGHLVYVNVQSTVQMVHLTARDYLLDPETSSEFAIEEKQGHRRLLLTCLSCLQSNDRKKAHPRYMGSNNAGRHLSPFIKYASESLHEHLRHMSWTDTSLLTTLSTFFKSPSILAWVEYIATNSDLSYLIATSEALGAFLGGIPEARLNEAEDLSMLNSWATDLVRLVMQFGSNLKAYPASIFNLIAPFCPSGTAPRRQFGSAPRGITVHGVRGITWGDCLSTISNPHQQYSGIASSENYFAISCFSGKIMIFKHPLYHQIAILDHLEPVRLLCFGSQEDALASASSKVIRVWNVASKSEIWQFDTPQQCMALAFADQGRQIVAAMKNHQLKVWNLADGSLIAESDWTVGLEERALRLYRRPATAMFSSDAQLLAVIYKGQDILLWDIECDCLYDLYNRDSGAADFAGRPYGSSGVRCLEFGSGANSDLLAAAYTDGELVLFGISSGEIRKRGVAAFAHMLTRSPDGSKLATADPSGTIQIFRFDTMELLYRIDPIEPGIQGLVFSGDGQRLLDVRGSRSRVWGPTVLVQRSKALGPITGKPQETDIRPVEDTVLITSIACHDSGDVFFCGKENGSVYLFDIVTGRSISTLFSHAHGVEIVSLQYHPESRTITSVDTSSRVLIHRLDSQGKTTVAPTVLFDHRAEFSIGQVVSRSDLDRILLCSTESDELWSISESGSKLVARSTYSQRLPYQWANHPLHSTQLLLITRAGVEMFDWVSFKRLSPPDGIRVDSQIPSDLSPRCIKSIFNNNLLAVMYGEVGRPLSKTKLVLFDTSQLVYDSDSIAEVTSYQPLCSKAIHLIGTVGIGTNERLMFLRNGHWIGSANVESARDGRVSSHFFFPADWMSTASHLDLMIEVTARGDVLMVKRDEVAVIRRGLARFEFKDDIASLE